MSTMQAVDNVTTNVVDKTTWAYHYIRTQLAPSSYQPISQESSQERTLDFDGDLSGGRKEKSSPRREMRRPRRLVPILMAVALLLLCWATRVFVVSPPTDPFLKVRRRLTKDEYIDAVMQNPVEGLVDLEPIRNRCQMAMPMPGLVWHCDYIQGGLGNLGNSWVGCMLFGIESGGECTRSGGETNFVTIHDTNHPATTIILPRVGVRDDSNLINNGNRGNTVDLSILYDLDYFIERWQEACPTIRVLRSDEEVPNLIGGHSLAAHEIPGLEVVRKTVVDTGSWRIKFEAWLQKHTKPDEFKNMSPEKPVRVMARGMLFAWHRASMDQQFAYAFARLFRFQPSLRRLGAAALWGLEQQAGHPIVSDAVLFPELYADIYAPSSHPAPPALVVNTSLITNLGRGRVLSHSFIGTHLRADSDAVKMHWPGYDAQVPFYLNEAVRRNLSTIYLAAGTPESITQFKADAAPLGLSVYTKEDVLDEDDLAEYEALTWDNRAVIDFQVLLHASFFNGFGQSTFSQTMSMRRTSMPDAGPNQLNPWRPYTNASFEMYRDNLSSIICGLHGQTLDMIWP